MATHTYTPHEGKTFGVRYFDGEPTIVSLIIGESGYRFIDSVVPEAMRSLIVPNTISPIDVWLRFDAEEVDEYGENICTHEANTFINEDGTYRIEWYLNSVGLVTPVHFDTLDEAYAWYERAGYEDFTSC